MRFQRTTLMALALTAVACGAPAGGIDVGDTSGVTSTSIGELDSPPTGSAETLIGCPSGPWFPHSSLGNQIDLASSGRDDILDAMAPFLDSEEGDFWPQEDWEILHANDDLVLVVHLEPPDQLSFITLENRGGVFTWAGAQMGGPCPLVMQTPSGLNTVDWRLEEGETPGADSTTVALVLLERECVSGQEIGDRLVGPNVVYGEERVLISFAAEPPAGDAFNCQGNPETPFELVLDEPLGDRVLVDGRDLGLSLEDVLG